MNLLKNSNNILRLAKDTDIDQVLKIKTDNIDDGDNETIDMIKDVNRFIHNYELLVLEDRNQILGYILLQKFLNLKIIRIINIAVIEKHNGYGSFIIEKIKQIYSSFNKIILEVNEENFHAISFYEKNNFIRHGKIGYYYGIKDGFRYEYELNKSDDNICLIINDSLYDQCKFWSIEKIKSNDFFEDHQENKFYINVSKDFSYNWLDRSKRTTVDYYTQLLCYSKELPHFPYIESLYILNFNEKLKLADPIFFKKLEDEISNINVKGTPYFKQPSISIKTFFDTSNDQFFNSIASLIFNKYGVISCELKFINTLSGWILTDMKFNNDEYTMYQLDKMEYFIDKHYHFIKNFKLEHNINYDNPIMNKIAIVQDSEEKWYHDKPSNFKTIDIMIDCAKQHGIEMESIQVSRLHKYSEYDGFFSRTSSPLTFFWSYLCFLQNKKMINYWSNYLKMDKVYAENRLIKKGFNFAKSKYLTKKKFLDCIPEFPIIIKDPSGHSSARVEKINNFDEYIKKCSDFFVNTDLIISQPFMRTDYDWRIIVLNGKILSTTQYFMYSNSWKIIDKDNGKKVFGKSKNFKIEEMNPDILNLCISALHEYDNDDLLGFDVKEYDGKLLLTDINAFPDIYDGIENQNDPDLYIKIIKRLIN